MLSVCLCARFQFCPKKSHLIVVKCIIRYLKGIIGMSLGYLRTGQLHMTIYLDVDYAGYKVNMKSNSETCQLLENCLVSWSFKKQNFIALSTVEVEHVVVEACCEHVLWLKHTLFDYDLHYDHIKILCNNISTIHMTKNANQLVKTNI